MADPIASFLPLSISAPSASFAHTVKPHRTLWYHAYSLWLFTFSDLKTIVIPKTAFGVITLLSGPILTTCPRPSLLAVLHCLPPIMTWIWLNLLPLSMNNQYGQDDLEEDRKNKPWRPIPAGRLTIDETKRLMLASYVAAILASAYLGGLPECLAIILQGWIYNEFGAANDSYVARNILNATGYMTFAAGAAEVACIQYGTTMQQGACLWFVLLGAVIATTIQFQDLYDQSGDSARGRRTLPLVVGDGIARLSVGVPIAIWSFLCPAFWRLDARCFVLPLTLGGFIIFRLFLYRSVSADKTSFKFWNAWVVVLYVLPFVKAIG